MTTSGNERPWPINDSYLGAMCRCLQTEPTKEYDPFGDTPRFSVMTPDGDFHYVIDIKYDGHGGVVLHTKPIMKE